MAGKYVMALDNGTTSSRTVIFDKQGKIVSVDQQEFTQIYPKPGWVEHDANEIWDSQIATAKGALQKAGLQPSDIAAIGITNQRETTVMWDKNTGEPVYNAIVWQCRRTAGKCDELRNKGLAKTFQSKTGLVVDAYFSGTKIAWLLENVPGVREKAEKGEVIFGNVDTWLIWKLSAGKTHTTDYSNASRTLVFNIHELKWDQDILKELNIPEACLPEALPSSYVYGHTDPAVFGAEVPISGDLGDQQGALAGQACYEAGMAKNTYGTGNFMLLNTGTKAMPSDNGLLTTIAMGVNGEVYYALEGSIFITGAAVQWLRDELRVIENAAESEAMANTVPDTNGVFMVPAFVGLGAPYWDSYARGTIVGLTRGAKREHLVRATLEAMAYQTRDVMEVMIKDSGVDLKEMRVDGGAVGNNFLMQFQADVLGVPCIRPQVTMETTALGAAYMAGLAVGYWNSLDEIKQNWQVDKVFEPQMGAVERDKLYSEWVRAVERSRGWIQE